MPAPSVAERLAAVADACVRIASQRHKSPIAPDVQRLSALFTSDRGSRARTYMRDPALRRAYLAFFVPHNVARIALLLQRVRGDGLLPDHGQPPRVVDVGAGPLSGVLACWAVYGRLGGAWAVDISKAALDDGAAVLDAVGADVGGLTLIEKSITAAPRSWLPPRGSVDVVIAANVLNEISDPREVQARVDVAAACVDGLADGGRVLIVEPSLRVEARALMGVRDEIVASNVAAVLSPCRGARTCPLLRTRGDWCHGELVWGSRPLAYTQLEQQTKLPKQALSTAHLLLASKETAAPKAGLRLVGGVMHADRDRRYACGRDLVTLEGSPRLPAAVGLPLRGSLVDDAAAAQAAPTTMTTPTTKTPTTRPAQAATSSRSDRGGRGPGPPRGRSSPKDRRGPRR